MLRTVSRRGEDEQGEEESDTDPFFLQSGAVFLFDPRHRSDSRRRRLYARALARSDFCQGRRWSAGGGSGGVPPDGTPHRRISELPRCAAFRRSRSSVAVPPPPGWVDHPELMLEAVSCKRGHTKFK